MMPSYGSGPANLDFFFYAFIILITTKYPTFPKLIQSVYFRSDARGTMAWYRIVVQWLMTRIQFPPTTGLVG